MSQIDRKTTISGLGAVHPDATVDGLRKAPVRVAQGSTAMVVPWFELIATHRSGLEDKLALFRNKAPSAKITSNPVALVERVMSTFFGTRESVLARCSKDGKTLDPALYFAYLSNAFLQVVAIIERSDAQQFYRADELVDILSECQRNLNFMAAVLPNVAQQFEQFAADNGGVVLPPYAVPDSAREAPPASNKRRSSIPVGVQALYPAHSLAEEKRATDRPKARDRVPTLLGLDAVSKEFEVTNRSSDSFPVGTAIVEDSDETPTDTFAAINTSMLPPPMVQKTAEQEEKKLLESLERNADKEFEALFINAYQQYFAEISATHYRAMKLIRSEVADPVQREKDVTEGEALIDSLEDLIVDPGEVLELALSQAIETIDNNPENYPNFVAYYIDRNQLDYRERFAQHAKNVFAEKSRAFADVHLPLLLKNLVKVGSVERDLNIHNHTLRTANDAGASQLSAIRDLIDQINSFDEVILSKDWPDALAGALTSQMVKSLGDSLYRSPKPDLSWGLYFYQSAKRELLDSVYQPIYDAYYPLCEEYQESLRAGVDEKLVAATHAESQVVAVAAAAVIDSPDSSTLEMGGETELTDDELAALNEAVDNGMVIETSEVGVTYAEMQEILATEAREKNKASFGEVDFSDIEIPGVDDAAVGETGTDRISNLTLSLASKYLKHPITVADQDPVFNGVDFSVTLPKIVEDASRLDVNDRNGVYESCTVFVEGVASESSDDAKLPPLPPFIDPNDYFVPEDYKKWMQQIFKSKDKVAEVNGYAVSICELGGYIMAKDGWIVFEDQVTDSVLVTDDFGREKAVKHTRTLGRWYFRPPNTFFPVYRPAHGNGTTEPVSMTVERVMAFYNSMDRNHLKALYNRSFGGKDDVADPFAGIPDNEPLFQPVAAVLGSAVDGSVNIEAQSQTPTDTTAVVDSGVHGDGFVQLPSVVEELGDVDEVTRPNIRTLEKRRKSRNWKYLLSAAALGVVGAMGIGSGYKALQQNSSEGAVASSSVSNSDGAKPVESAKVAEVKSAQPQPVMTAPPQNPNVPPATVLNVNDLPLRTYVAPEILAKIPSEYTRKVVETGKYTVEGNGLGWAAQIATPFTRIASKQQLDKINELQHELNVGLYASSVKKYENAANVNAILMNPQHPEYARVKFLIKKNVMGSPYDWDWKIFSRNTGKSWNVQAAYEYYQTFEKEAMARNMDRHSPGVLHMGAWGGDVVEVYKDAKFMTYMIDVAEIVGIDLKPPTTGSVDPSMLQNQVPGAPGFIPGVDQPGVAPSLQNKTGFLSPNISDKLNFGFDSFYGNTGNFVQQPQYTVNFKAAAVESEPASFDVDLSDLEPSVLALGGIDDLSVDVDLSELNANTLAAMDDSIDVDVSAFDTLSEEDAFDAEWGNIADQHEAKNVVEPMLEKVTRVKSNRREALMKHGEVWVPSLSDDLSGSAMMAFENGFLKECTSESQQQKVRAILSKIRMGNLEEYEAMEDGSTYAKLSEKDMDALRIALNVPSQEDELASIDAGWDMEDSEQTAESAMIVDVSRRVNQRVGVVKLSA